MAKEECAPSKESLVDEVLTISAPIARAMAEQLCVKDPLSEGTCAWYHGFWPYMRLLGLGAAPSVHARGLIPVLTALAQTGDYQKVLISGAADYSMLAHVICAYNQAKAALKPTVVDVCDTPLYLNRWYAERVSVDIDTQRSDIRFFESFSPFDLICTHAFLGYFTSRDRLHVVRNWYKLLRPGGKVMTIQRIRPHADRETLSFTPTQAKAFVDRVAIAAKQNHGLDNSTREWLGAAAREYADKFWTNPICSQQELAMLFEEASFRVETLEKPSSDIQANGALSGPTIPMQAEYLFVVATRQ